MKSSSYLLLAGLPLAAIACIQKNLPPAPPGSRLAGAFEATTPCGPQIRPLPQIAAHAECEQVIWKLALFESPTGVPTRYALNAAYGVPKRETPQLAGGGTPIVAQGSWTIAKGTRADPNATVVELYAGDSQPIVSLLKLSDDLLHVLGGDRSLLVGNPSWSYTFNRMDNRSGPSVGQPSLEPETTEPRPYAPPAPRGSVVVGIFEGRIPCHALVFEITEQEPYDCEKTKSRLTLYRDEKTGAPSAYLFHAVGRRAATLYRQGTWTVVNGRPGDPKATIYQLKPMDTRPISFLRADENNLFMLDRALDPLVGNARFSYTLSKVDK